MLGYHRQARILGARRPDVNEIVVCRSLSSAHNSLTAGASSSGAWLVGQPPVSQAVSLFLMKILVIGGGAREHAMAWKLSRERSVTAVFCAPGNPGIASVARCLDADVGDPKRTADVARSQAIDLTVVGPELPLSRGIVDVFTADGRAIVGPIAGRGSARVEQGVRQRLHGTAQRADGAYHVCDSATSALAWLEGDRFGYPLVLKADGLAAGKGVVIVDDRAAAAAAVRSLMVERRFGSAGDRIVFEEFLVGQEASYFVLADGTSFIPLGSAQDHKRIFDDDQGPNTGGMGAFAPSPLVTPEIERRVVDEIVWPVLDGMQHEGHPYRGFLYVGLMLTADGPKVVEFNVRLGDPETQVVLPMLDEELSWLLGEAAMGALPSRAARFVPGANVGVVLAAGGYPEAVETGQPITGIDDAAAVPDALVFHAGTSKREGQLVTSGGRVLTVVGRGQNFGRHRDSYRHGISRHASDDIGRVRRACSSRHDIGRKALTSNVKYSIITFGCRVNQADSFAIARDLHARGAVEAPPQDAELVVVNTCSVTAAADQGVRQTVRRIVRDNPGVRVVVTGCYATRRPDEISRASKRRSRRVERRERRSRRTTCIAYWIATSRGNHDCCPLRRRRWSLWRHAVSRSRRAHGPDTPRSNRMRRDVQLLHHSDDTGQRTLATAE